MIREKSYIKVTKYLNIVLHIIGHEPQILEWTNLKTNSAHLLILELDELRWCFANWHDSQSNEDTL